MIYDGSELDFLVRREMTRKTHENDHILNHIGMQWKITDFRKPIDNGIPQQAQGSYYYSYLANKVKF